MKKLIDLSPLESFIKNRSFYRLDKSSSHPPWLKSGNPTNLLHSIQVLRGIAALMVVVSHIGVIERKYGYPNQHLLARADIGQAGVDLFFLISGFIMVVTMARRFGSLQGVTSFLVRRFIRIYPIYWVFALVICLAQAIRPEWVNSSYPGETRYLTSFLLLPGPGIPIMMVAWTLEYEVSFYLIFGLLMLLPFRWLLPILTLLFGGLVLLGILITPEGFWAGWAMHPILLEFLLGAALAHLHLQKRWGVGWLLTFAGVALWGIAAAGPAGQPIRGLGESLLERPINFGIPAALLLYGLVSLEQTNGIKFPGILQKMGDASYSLYLSHVLVVTAGGRLWMAAGGNQWPVNLLLVVLLLLLAGLVGWLVYVLIERPLINFLQRRWLKEPQRSISRTPA